MDELFIGSAVCAVSKDGGVILPPTFRQAARLRAGAPQVRLFVDRFEGSDCLTIFDRTCLAHGLAQDTAWTADGTVDKTAHAATLRRRYAFATMVEMHADGLIILPQIARSRLTIRDTVLLVATGQSFELWDVQFVLEWGHADLVALVQLHQDTPPLAEDRPVGRRSVRPTPRRLPLASHAAMPIAAL